MLPVVTLGKGSERKKAPEHMNNDSETYRLIPLVLPYEGAPDGGRCPVSEAHFSPVATGTNG